MADSSMLSPVTDFINEQKKQVLHLWKNKRILALQFLNLALVISFALICWKMLMIYTNSESPIVVVLSGSMEPAFYRGDILWLDNSMATDISVGEIIVFKVKDKEIPIVHRVMEMHQFNVTTAETVGEGSRWEQGDDEGKKILYLTKGDNNRVNDRGLYMPGQMWLEREDILGRVRGIVRYMGMVTIILNDFPPVKYGLIGLMGYFVLTNKE